MYQIILVNYYTCYHPWLTTIQEYTIYIYNYFDVFLLLVFAIGLSLYIYREAIKNIGWIFLWIIALGILMLYVIIIVHFMDDICPH